MGLYEVPLSVSLLDFGMGTMLANFHNYEEEEEIRYYNIKIN